MTVSQSAQYPDLRQNTFNYKVNYGLPDCLELDFDAPYPLHPITRMGLIKLHRSGDADMGIKWNFRKCAAADQLRTFRPACTLSFQPVMRNRNWLRLTDYWLNSSPRNPCG